jgi:hypothetical protein
MSFVFTYTFRAGTGMVFGWPISVMTQKPVIQKVDYGHKINTKITEVWINDYATYTPP